MTTAIRRLKNPPPLPRAVKREQFPEVSFQVLHARVIEAFEAKIPVTHGGGYTVRGYGTSWVNTTVRDELSVWLVDHQTGQQHKMDFGSDYLPMRMGHDVTLLWANGQLITIANHTTGQLKHPALHRPILRDKPVGSAWFHVILIPILLFLTATFFWVQLAQVHGLIIGMSRPQRWAYTDSVFDHPSLHPLFHSPTLATIFVLGVLALSFAPSILAARCNRANRQFNLGQRAYLDENLRIAESRWVRQYVPPRAVPW
jgi:hypothetical protein